MKSVAVALRKVKRLIENHGWIKRDWAIVKDTLPNNNLRMADVKTYPIKKICGFCLDGALMRVCGEDDDLYRECCHVMNRTLKTFHYNGGIIGYNDAKHRRKQDVINLLTKSAERADNEGLYA